MMDTVLASLGRIYGGYLDNGTVPQPLGSGTDMGVPNGAFPAKDGWVTLAALSNKRFANACAGLGLSELANDPRFATREDRRVNAEAIIEAFGAATSVMTRAEAVAKLEKHGVSCAEVRTVPEVAADPTFAYAFVEIPVDGARTARTVGSPLRFSRTPVTLRCGIPGLGEDGEEIRRELRHHADETPDAAVEEGAILP
jgi:crotonobetainyl-CoA:carnitine CoA-transferase CaiB-like acyl-CoA transferase